MTYRRWAAVATAVLFLSAGDARADTVDLSRVAEFAYNPERRWVPRDDDKGGYWHQEDFGYAEHVDLDLESRSVAVVTRRTQPREYRLITLDLDSGRVRRNQVALDQFGARIEGMALSPDARRIAVTEGKAARFTLWNAESLTRLGSGATDGTVNAVAWSPDGSRLAVTDKTSVEIWTVDGAPERQSFVNGVRGRSGAEWVSDVAWSPDGDYLAIGTNEPAVYIHNLRRGAQSSTLQPQPSGSVTQVEWSPNGEFLVARVQGHDGEINIWAHPKRAVDSPFTEPKYAHVARIAAAASGQDLGPLAIDPASRMVVFPNKAGELRFHDLESGARLASHQAHRGSVAGVEWEGDTLLTYGMYPDRHFVRWRVETSGSPGGEAPPAPERACLIRGAVTGDTMFVGGVALWSMDSGTRLETAVLAADGTYRFGLLGDGAYVVVPEAGGKFSLLAEPGRRKVVCRGKQEHVADFIIRGISEG